MLGRIPPSGLRCPVCAEELARWRRATLFIESCPGCRVLFLDRGELYEMFRAEGYRCPPEAFFRATFTAGAGEPLTCPKCERDSLLPGTLQGCEAWHCTPCNGFMVEWSLLMGSETVEEKPLARRGFQRDAGSEEAPPADSRDLEPGYLYRMLQRMGFWTPSEIRELE